MISLVIPLAVVITLVFLFGKVELGKTASTVVAGTVDSLIREIPNDAFGPGEEFRYTIGYGFITAGEATLEVVDTATVNGFLCYSIQSLTNSNGFFDSFYRVRDTIVSKIDADGVFSHYFFKALHEGSYHSSREIKFDYLQRRAISYTGKDDIDTLGISPFTQDVLSAMYYVRTLPLALGKSIKVPSVSGDTSTVLEVRVIKRETVVVPAGEFKCIVVEPMLTAAGVFKHEGEIRVWLTDDRLRMPVLMKSKVVVGSIYAELEEFKLGDLDW